jgi:hypothetical protein
MLRRTAKNIVDWVLEVFGYPSTLRNFLSTNHGFNQPLAKYAKTIASNDVVKWSEFGKPPYGHGTVQLKGWTYSPESLHKYGETRRELTALQHLITTQLIKNWECEIQDVGGFSSSQSTLSEFKTTAAMVEHDSKEMIDEITQEKLDENLAHGQIRIIHEPGHDYFQTWTWDGRVFLMNSGGSHHFAAAQYIAVRIGVRVPLQGEYHIQSINQIALADLRREFDIFVMSSIMAPKNGFHDALKAIQATYYWRDLPFPYHKQSAVFLPKTEKKSLRVAQILRAAGFQDLGLYLGNLGSR